MVEPFTTSMTTSDNYTGTVSIDYDYENYTESTGMCDRSSVRAFRGQYEPPLFWIIFVLGSFGNLLVVWIYSTGRNRWEFGVGPCKMVFAIYKINFFSSMLLLTCISVDRYIAIVQVTKAQNLKKKRLFYSKLVCLVVWLVSIFLSLPELIFAQVKTNDKGQSSCVLVYWNNIKNQTKILVLSLQISMGFCLPLLVMFFCYSVIIRTLQQARNFEKHKALRVIFTVVFVFIISQLPLNSLLILEATQSANITLTDCETVIGFDVAGQVATGLAYTHACLNPFLYVFIGVRFRQDLLRIVRICVDGLGSGGFSKLLSVPKRPSAMSDSDTTQPPLFI
uniref:G-protein coupled receptors family 1 profile domain-containing protein n=1 Tax=Mola mola TaxID=94237 RepID=A0A3Q3VT34_MOLML